ncbi:MAG: xanthine dehydrogenase family protein subunit M [Pseudomonadota bacterium]|nr:xanthine dehydrogenase family protein subunit M [Pseudomonadota bacterium]
MIDFAYTRADDTAAAVRIASREGANARYLGGGTNLVDLMREEIERPPRVIDVSGLATRIDDRADGGLVIGAGVRNTALAADRRVREHWPVLSEAILNGASAQIRNMATAAGNLLQRTRCYYFYDSAARCNKRRPGTGCDAVGGFNRIHAILGASAQCVATHPSDMAVALVALDASVLLEGPDGVRSLPLRDLHRLPGTTPEIETELRPGELITAIDLPRLPDGCRSAYRKVRDRSSYAFALVSVAAALAVENGQVKHVRIALGGVAHKPWRASVAEAALQGRAATPENFQRAAEAELVPAVGLSHNGFKIDLARRVIVDVLGRLAAAEGAH